MTSEAKSSISLDTSGIVTDPVPDAFVFAADVVTPLDEAQGHLEDARERLSVSANDTHFKHLYDAIAAGTGMSKAIISPSGDEQVELDATVVGDPPGRVLIDDNVLSSAASSISITSISSIWDEWLLVAWLRGTSAANLVGLITRVGGDSTAANYYSQRLRSSGTLAIANEVLGTTASLTYSGDGPPAGNSPSGAWGLVEMHLIGVNSSTYGVKAGWRIAAPQLESSGNIRFLAGTGWYDQLSVVSQLDIIPSGGNWAANSRYKLYGMKGS